MKRDWEQTFRSWSKPTSDTEELKCENAERMVRDAISNDSTLAKMAISINTQGSYRNNTNVVSDSDVDIYVCCHDLIIPNYEFAKNLNNTILGFKTSNYPYNQFKNDVETALRNKFGFLDVTRGKKAFNVHANTYRVDADVVPTMEYRLYNSDISYSQGTYIITDTGQHIFNYPVQHYNNGVAKNNCTKNRFKFITRVMKRLRNEMAENKIAVAHPIPSYLIECLIYNVPNYLLEGDSYKKNIMDSISYIWWTENKCTNWFEVNRIKYLFCNTQSWTKEDVNAFIFSAWNYINLN